MAVVKEIGLATLQNQIHAEASRKGFEFNLLVVGQCGLGKSTFVNSLFASPIYQQEQAFQPARLPKTTDVQTCTLHLEENGVPLALTVIDTPGFGNAINSTDSWVPILSYIDEMFAQYERVETSVDRVGMSDSRVHCCLYFLPPCTHGVAELDIKVMQELQGKVNLIPVIAKADSLTGEECALLKQRVLQCIDEHSIATFQVPEGDEQDDDVVKAAKDVMPFAVCASQQVIVVDGKEVPARVFPWGTTLVTDPSQSDFALLRDLLIRTYMQHLIDLTNDVHYERYRLSKLEGLRPADAESESEAGAPATQDNIIARLELDLAKHTEKLRETEQNMQRVFQEKVKRREEQMDSEEAQLLEMTDRMKDEVEARHSEYQQMQADFEAAKAAYREQMDALLAKPAPSTRRKTWGKMF
eukprot:m.179639 g.179639  ORF g.179639 m.179639 type:complete len:413 (-) comp14643_c0_seq2:2089-3327(-)